LVDGVGGKQELASPKKLIFPEIEQDEIYVFLQIETPALTRIFCGDRALNSAWNGIKSSIVLTSGDRTRSSGNVSHF